MPEVCESEECDAKKRDLEIMPGIPLILKPDAESGLGILVSRHDARAAWC
jgi:hypothetical protein